MDEETGAFIRDSLDSLAKLDVALFLHRNRFAVDSAAGLAQRLGRAVEELEPELKEMAAGGVVTLYGDPEGDRPCLYGFTRDGWVARRLREVAEACEGPDRAAVLSCVLEGASRRHHLRVRELRRLDDLKTQFLSLVSHELRSPLTAIKGYVEVVRSHPDLAPEERDLFLRTAAAHCERLKTTVNNVLLAAEMQQEEGWRGDCRPLDLRDLVARLVEELAAVEPRRVFQFEAPESVPRALADETGTELVLRNLLDNATKFSLEGSTVRVRLEAGEGEVAVHIGDEGIGISPDQLRAVFEPFYQAEYYRTRRAEGSGLGLYLVREIMERMGGRISVRSELGRGSVFTCVFRAAEEEAR